MFMLVCGIDEMLCLLDTVVPHLCNWGRGSWCAKILCSWKKARVKFGILSMEEAGIDNISVHLEKWGGHNALCMPHFTGVAPGRRIV